MNHAKVSSTATSVPVDFRNPNDTELGSDQNADEVTKIHADCLFDPSAPDASADAIFRLNGVPVATAGNIVTITGAPKSGKTAMIASMAAAALVRSPVEALKFDSIRAEGAVIVFDTEQTRGHRAIGNRMLVARTGLIATPSRLRTLCVKGCEPATMRKVLDYELRCAAAIHKSVHSVFIDGVADLVVDPNGGPESNELVAWLERLAQLYSTVVVAVLHLNPVSGFHSGVKSRGHLGSQLERKAETEIRLRRDSDGATSYWTQFARGEPIPEAAGLRFRWCNNNQYHVPAGSKAEERAITRGVEIFQDALQVLGSTGDDFAYREILERTMAAFGIKEKAAEARFAKWRKSQLLESPSARRWRLRLDLAELAGASEKPELP